MRRGWGGVDHGVRVVLGLVDVHMGVYHTSLPMLCILKMSQYAKFKKREGGGGRRGEVEGGQKGEGEGEIKLSHRLLFEKLSN